MARVREQRLKRGDKGPPSGIQVFLQGALAKLGATLVRLDAFPTRNEDWLIPHCAAYADMTRGVAASIEGASV